MPTFIKTGFWEQTCRTCKGYNGWLNLDDFLGGSGTSGTSGPQGPSGSQGVQGSQGIQGVQGVQGVQGETGAALTVLGSYPDLAAFLAGAGGSPGAAGEAWLIESDGSLYIWNTATNAWEDVGDLQGPAGVQGAQGIQGIQGSQGVQGIQGVAGTAGTAGTSGLAGSSGSSGTAGLSGTSGTSYSPPLPVVYGLYAQTANSTAVTGTITESTLIGSGVGSLSIPANGFTVGDSFGATFGGILSTGNNQTFRIRVKAGSTVLLDSGVQNITNITNNVWSLEISFTIRALGAAGVASIVSLGTFHYLKTVNGTFEGFSFNTLNNTTFDTTVSNTLNVTIEWGSTSGLNNIYSDIFVLNKTY
jgi:hypothetical protein